MTKHFFLLSFLLCFPSFALITGNEGNDPVQNHFWPKGSEEVTNLKTRVAHWEGPPFGGGESTFEYQAKSTADFNEALTAFATVESEKKELIVRSGPKESFWLGISANREGREEPLIDWTFTVRNPDVWKQLYQGKNSGFLSDHPNFGKPLPAPRITLYLGGGNVDWDEVKVPKGITVIQKRDEKATGLRISGKITDLATGEGLEGVTVSLAGGPQGGNIELPVVETGSDGQYEIKEFLEGTYTVTAAKEGYASRKALAYHDLRGTDFAEEDLALSKSEQLAGVVRGPDGQTVEGARIIVRDFVGSDGMGYPGADRSETKTDAEGKFRFTGLPTGTCRISVWKEGLYDKKGVLETRSVPSKKPITIEMIGTGIVRGVLKVPADHKGQLNVSIEPPGGNVVGSWGGSMHCKPDGSFEFKGVPEGEYLVGPSSGPNLDSKNESVKKIMVKSWEVVELTLQK